MLTTFSSNLEFKKKIIKRGDKDCSASIELGHQATIHYEGYLSDGSVFDSTWASNTPFVFTLGAGMVIDALEKSVMSMQIGEIALIKSIPKHAWGRLGLPPRVPQNATVSFKVELVELKAPNNKACSLEELQQFAIKDKDRGNEFVSKNQFEEAEKCYAQALARFEGLSNLTDNEIESINKIKIPIYSNLSHCDLKLNNLSRAIAHCNEVLKLDANNIKSHNRIGQAYEQSGELKAARNHYIRLAKLNKSTETYANVERIKKKDTSRTKRQRIN